MSGKRSVAQAEAPDASPEPAPASVFRTLQRLDPAERGELLCRTLNPGAREFFHDGDSLGVRIGAPNAIPVRSHPLGSYQTTLVRTDDLPALWCGLRQRQIDAAGTPWRNMGRRLFGRYQVSALRPIETAELCLSELAVQASGELNADLARLLLGPARELHCPRHPVHGADAPRSWQGVPTGTMRTLELISDDPPHYLKMSVDKAAKARHRGKTGPGSLRALRNKIRTDLKKRAMKVAFGCDNVDGLAITRDDALYCLALTVELAAIFRDRAPSAGFLPELAACVEPDGRGTLIRSGRAWPESTEPELLVPFYSLGYLGAKDAVPVHLLAALAAEQGRSAEDVVVEACLRYLELWFELSFTSGYFVCCPHGQNAMLAIGPSGDLRRIVLKDLRDIERWDRFFAGTSELQSLVLISRPYLRYQQAAHPLYYRFRPFAHPQDQLAANAVAYSYWMLQNRGLGPLLRAVGPLEGSAAVLRARHRVLEGEARLLARAFPESRAVSLPRPGDAAASATALVRMQRALYAGLRTAWVRRARERYGS